MRPHLLLPSFTLFFCAVCPCFAQIGRPDQKPNSGHCSEQSHTAEGVIGTDLTKHQTRFICDTATVVFLDHFDKHVRVQFFDSKSKGRELGFAGVMEDGGQVMDVVFVYLTREKSVLATDGACKFFFEKPSILDLVSLKSIFCGAKIDKDSHRTVMSVVFEADPGQ